MMERKGDWMQTFTGRKFWPLDPRPEEIEIEDIAHALSMLCRYGGHTLQFYSVAEHCCHIYDRASNENKLWALLHDASEAYLADLIRPIKMHLEGYKPAEKRVMESVCSRFGMEIEEPSEVSELDKRILGDEANQAMSRPPEEWYYKGKPLGLKLAFWPPATAKKQFLSRFDAATAKREKGEQWTR